MLNAPNDNTNSDESGDTMRKIIIVKDQIRPFSRDNRALAHLRSSPGHRRDANSSYTFVVHVTFDCCLMLYFVVFLAIINFFYEHF